MDKMSTTPIFFMLNFEIWEISASSVSSLIEVVGGVLLDFGFFGFAWKMV